MPDSSDPTIPAPETWDLPPPPSPGIGPGFAVPDLVDASTVSIGWWCDLESGHKADELELDGEADALMATQASPPSFEPPSRLTPEVDGYKIGALLGSGGMGRVYRAWKLSLNSDCALKFLPSFHAVDPGRLRRFWKEAKIGQEARGAHLLPALDLVWARDGVPALVLMFVDGPDLLRVIKVRAAQVQREQSAGASDETRAASQAAYLDWVLPLLDQAVEAVAWLHDPPAHRGVILHLDVKPANCLTDGVRELFLADFGLAKSIRDVTETGTFQGTRGYASPEQYDGRKELDTRSDVFSLAATIFHVLTLRLPYGKERARSDNTHPRPSLAGTGLPKGYERVLRTALAPEAELRYPDAVAFRRDWERVRHDQPPTEALRFGFGRRLLHRAARHPTATAYSLIFPIALLAGFLFLMFREVSGGGSGLKGLELIPVRCDFTAPTSRLAFIPLDDRDGEPVPASPFALRLPGSRTRSVDLRLARGHYLIVVEWPDGRFHEVFRHVPDSKSKPTIYPSEDWKVSGGVVVLPTIEPPPVDVRDGMARFDGYKALALPVLTPDLPARRVDVGPFWLDAHEWTVAEFLELRRRRGSHPTLPPHLRIQQPGGLEPASDEPIRNIQYLEALLYLELAGKRPPTLAEFHGAATRGGTRPHPWGSELPPPSDPPWPIGPIGVVPIDRTDTDPPVLGLVSNVGEWTSTPVSALLPVVDFGAPIENPNRFVFGAPGAVVLGELNAARDAEDHKGLFSLPSREHWTLNGGRTPMNVGVRGARSLGPRFLDPPRP